MTDATLPPLNVLSLAAWYFKAPPESFIPRIPQATIGETHNSPKVPPREVGGISVLTFGSYCQKTTWAPKVCKIMAFMAIIMGLGLLFYILLGFE